MKWYHFLLYKIWLFWIGITFYEVGKSILSVFGALWGIVEILAYFGQPEVSVFLKSIWWVFLIFGLCLIAYRHRPKLYYSFEVEKRDVKISIRIGDILKTEGSIVIPINNRLDADNKGIISKSSSILKQFISSKYDGHHQHLSADIQNVLGDEKEWYSNFKESESTFKVGTVLPVFKDEQFIYLLCDSTLNDQGRSKCTEEDLRQSLSELWTYLEINGNKDQLILPILGTGRGRLNLTRTEVIKETVLSFLVSLSSGSYIEELCIIIHPYDMKKYKIDLVELLDFIRLHCINTNYIVNQRNPKGIGLD